MADAETLVGGMAGRYAAALFDLAKEANALDATASDLARLNDLIRGNAELTRLIRSPMFSRAQQANAIGAVLARLGVSDLTRRFVLVLAQNRRLFALPGIVRAYATLLAKARGEVRAQVASPYPLTPSQRSEIENTLKDQLKAKIALTEQVDPSLLGGLVVRVGSRMIDSSLKTKLANLKAALIEA